MELLEFWKIIRKRLWLILACVVLAGAGAAYFSWRQPRLYSATTTLFLRPASSGPVLLPPYQEVQTLANTYSEYMRTQTFAGLVAQQLTPALSDAAVSRAITSQWVSGTQFFRITATHTSPQVAQSIANQAAEVLIDQNIARQQAQRRQLEAQNDPSQASERTRLAELQKALDTQIADTRTRIDTLQRQVTELESKPRSTDVDLQITALRDTLVKTQAQLVDLLASQSRVQTSQPGGASSLSADTAVVVDAAPLPANPLPGKRTQTLVFAVLGGLILGLGLAFLLEYLQYAVKTPEQLDTLFGSATLGIIGSLNGAARKRLDAKSIVALSQPVSPTAEAFRALRATLHFVSRPRALHDLVVTSAAPNEGKSFVAANLAVTLAQSGRRVILVDADLRRPVLHRVFNVPAEPGFTDLVLDAEATPDRYLHPTALPSLWVLPCGTLPSNPVELFSQPRVAEVMDALKERAELVIYDSPPAAVVIDAVVLASRTDGVIQVVRAGGVRPDVVVRVKESLTQAGAHVLGPVLNLVSPADLGYASLYYQTNGHAKSQRG